MTKRREHSHWRYSALLFTALVGLSVSACDDPVDLPNAPATIPAVGNIDGPVEGCSDEIVTQRLALDAGDVGDTGDAGGVGDAGDAGDAGMDASVDVGQDADDAGDGGVDTDADAGDAGPGTDAGVGDTGDAGQDTGPADVGVGDAGDAGVSQDADQPDAGPTPTPVRITRDGDALVIPYLIKDREGDDQRINVELCEWNGSEAVNCGVASQAAGGDGTSFVPTTPADTCILHVFYWDVGCGRFVGTDDGANPQQAFIESVDQELVARVSVVGSEEEPSRTEPFTLEGIGFESVPECD